MTLSMKVKMNLHLILLLSQLSRLIPHTQVILDILNTILTVLLQIRIKLRILLMLLGVYLQIQRL